jgi:hypothetical protein
MKTVLIGGENVLLETWNIEKLTRLPADMNGRSFGASRPRPS